MTAADVAPPEGVSLKPITQVSRGGTSRDLIDLAEWASWRWAGRLVHLLDTATNAQGSIRSGTSRAEPGVTVVRVPPASPRPTFEGALVVEGRRSIVWAPAPRVQAIVVVDEHDEGLQEERAPTWHAR